MISISETICKNIMDIMKQKGKTQIDLADYLGVSGANDKPDAYRRKDKSH